MAGRNFQPGRAAMIFAVMAAGPGSTTWTVGVKVVLPVASCIRLVSVAPTALPVIEE